MFYCEGIKYQKWKSYWSLFDGKTWDLLLQTHQQCWCGLQASHYDPITYLIGLIEESNRNTLQPHLKISWILIYILYFFSHQEFRWASRWLSACFILTSSAYIIEETWQTLVAIMLGKKVDIGGGQIFKKQKNTALHFLCWSNFSFFAVNQKYSKNVYGLIACLIGTVQPPLNTSGRFCPTWIMDICIGFTRQASRWIYKVGYFCPNSMAFCTNMLRRISYFSPRSPQKSHRSPSPATPRKNGLGCKWLVHVKFFHSRF